MLLQSNFSRYTLSVIQKSRFELKRFTHSYLVFSIFIMEQHPIPQDVTGFQFKLIGAMTVKQFGFVAAGAILAVISWYAPVQGFFWNFLAKGIFLPVCGLSGIIIAFVPIEGRPIDIMAVNFFYALTSPNQYIYKKKGKKFSFNQITLAKITPSAPTAVKKIPETGTAFDNQKSQQLRALLSQSYKDAKNTLDKKEFQFLESIASIPVPQETPLPAKPLSQVQPAMPPMSNPPVHSGFPKPMLPIQNKQSDTVKKAMEEVNASHEKMLELEKQTQDINTQKDLAERELLKLKNQMSAPIANVSPANPQPQAAPNPPPAQDITHVRNIPQNMTKNAGFSHIPDSPNIIVGIVKDSRANTLPNILVEIKDKDGNPVRAFKTNPLGQFASATPLANGTYTIALEDPKKQHAFDIIQINALGEIMLPIEIISHDAREELRKALFTN